MPGDQLSAVIILLTSIQVDSISDLMSVDDVAKFLQTYGIPPKICDVFRGSYISTCNYIQLLQYRYIMMLSIAKPCCIIMY